MREAPFEHLERARGVGFVSLALVGLRGVGGLLARSAQRLDELGRRSGVARGLGRNFARDDAREAWNERSCWRDDVTLARWLPGTLSDFATQRAQRRRFTAAVILFGAFVTVASGMVALLAP